MRLCQGELGHRLERSFTRDERDTAAFYFNTVAAELERVIRSSKEQEQRLAESVEKLSKVLIAVASGDFSQKVSRDFRGDSIDVLAYLINNTINELALLVERNQFQVQEVLQAQQELVQRERLAVLGQLTATVSHELRNPLAALRVSVQHLSSRLKPHAPEVESSFHRIERTITRCDRLVEELLDFARATALDPNPVLFDAFLNEVASELAIPPEVSLIFELSCPKSRVLLDKDRFRRVLVNLVTNGVQAVQQSNGARGAVTVSTRASSTELELGVADTGPGFPEEIRPRVFEPLFSTKSFGVGLGLAIVKRIVEQHGGQIEVPQAKGGLVVVRLPLLSA